MKLAVTGASGFIGGYVLRELERRGTRAMAVAHRRADDLVRGYHPVAVMDIHDPGPDPFAGLGTPDVLIHLAWGLLPDYGSPAHLAVELPAHARFLAELVKSGLSGLVVAGTCMEYGMREGVLREDDVADPANPYAAAKNSLRLELERIRTLHAFDLTWARLFYLYGAGQAPTSLFAQLAAAHSTGDHSLDMSSGEQVRDYMPVEGAAAALVDLALHPGSHGVVNVCSGRPVAVREIAARWIEENHWTVSLRLGARAKSPFEPRAFWGDRAKLDRLLGGLAA
jgi:dTDP-6-deoxy-L-talose 4-dehydrogenase (NAD+)